jgi:hypothetical protein
MLAILRSLLFGCAHARTTFPMTLMAGLHLTSRTYVTCLHCGKEFKYDWATMRMGGSRCETPAD